MGKKMTIERLWKGIDGVLATMSTSSRQGFIALKSDRRLDLFMRKHGKELTCLASWVQNEDGYAVRAVENIETDDETFFNVFESASVNEL